MEIPSLSEEEKQKLFTEMWLGSMMGPLQFAEKGMPMTKEQHCSGCINGYFKRVTKNLGFTLDVAFGDKGCKMTISK